MCTGYNYLIGLSVCLSCLSVYVFHSSLLLIGRAVPTRPISANPVSIEAGEYELTRGTCFVARRLEVVTVTGLLWVSCCVLGAVVFRVFLEFTFSNS